MADSAQADTARQPRGGFCNYDMEEACCQNNHLEFLNGIWNITLQRQPDNTLASIEAERSFLVIYGRRLTHEPDKKCNHKGETIAVGAITSGSTTYNFEIMLNGPFETSDALGTQCELTLLRPGWVPVQQPHPLEEAILNSFAKGHRLRFAFVYDDTHQRGFSYLALNLRTSRPSGHFDIAAVKVPYLPYAGQCELDPYSKGLIKAWESRHVKQEAEIRTQGELDEPLREDKEEGDRIKDEVIKSEQG